MKILQKTRGRLARLLDRIVMQNPGLAYEINDNLITLDLNVLGSRMRDYITQIEQQHTDNLPQLIEMKLDQMHNKLLYA